MNAVFGWLSPPPRQGGAGLWNGGFRGSPFRRQAWDRAACAHDAGGGGGGWAHTGDRRPCPRRALGLERDTGSKQVVSVPRKCQRTCVISQKLARTHAHLASRQPEERPLCGSVNWGKIQSVWEPQKNTGVPGSGSRAVDLARALVLSSAGHRCRHRGPRAQTMAITMAARLVRLPLLHSGWGVGRRWPSE